MASHDQTAKHTCAAAGCSNFRIKGQPGQKSFFRFPSDKDRCDIWIANSGRKQFLNEKTRPCYESLCKNYKLCSDHFEDSQFKTAEKNRLVWGAIPSLFDSSSSPHSQTGKRQLSPKKSEPPAKKIKTCDVSSSGDAAPSDNTYSVSTVPDVDLKKLTKEKTAYVSVNVGPDVLKNPHNESLSVSKVNLEKTKKAQQHSLTPYNCYVKLYRCDQDPKLKGIMARIKLKNKSLTSSLQANGLVVKANSLSAPQKIIVPLSNSKYLLGTRQGQQQSFEGYKSQASSLNVVVVHPKPGTKIINTAQPRQMKPNRLHSLIANPNTVISNKVIRVMTTGGNFEFKCDKCTMTYRVVRDLINHKRLAHKSARLMCVECAAEFYTPEAKEKHRCSGQYKCDICGFLCGSLNGFKIHKEKAHNKTLGDYMCAMCCFNANTQSELDSHVCGGKPKINYAQHSSKTVMVYPALKKDPGQSAASSNVYINLPDLSQPALSASISASASSTSNSMQFLCEECLDMFHSREALASHECCVVTGEDDDSVKSLESPVSANPSKSVKLPISAKPSTSFQLPASASPKTMAQSLVASQPLPSFGMEVMPEVEQLAKFYSSVVFNE